VLGARRPGVSMWNAVVIAFLAVSSHRGRGAVKQGDLISTSCAR